MIWLIALILDRVVVAIGWVFPCYGTGWFE